jgi:IS1 family transposase
MVYAKDLATFQKLFHKFKNVKVRKYVEKNWMNIHTQWNLFIGNESFLHNTSTTNKVERYFGKIKKVIKLKQKFYIAVTEILKFHVYDMNLIAQKYRHSIVKIHSIEQNEISYMWDFLSPHAYNLTLEQFNKSNQRYFPLSQAKYYTDTSGCTCDLTIRNGIPCSHLLKYQNYKNLKKHYHKYNTREYFQKFVEDVDNILFERKEVSAENISKNIEPKLNILKKAKFENLNDKYKQVTAITNKVNGIIITKTRPIYEQYINIVQLIESIIISKSDNGIKESFKEFEGCLVQHNSFKQQEVNLKNVNYYPIFDRNEIKNDGLMSHATELPQSKKINIFGDLERPAEKNVVGALRGVIYKSENGGETKLKSSDAAEIKKLDISNRSVNYLPQGGSKSASLIPNVNMVPTPNFEVKLLQANTKGRKKGSNLTAMGLKREKQTFNEKGGE